MLQHLKEYHESRLWFEASLAVCESVFGKDSINAATLLFQLAQALALDQDPKAAVNRMRQSYSIFLTSLGPTDKNTKEAESWLEQLTQVGQTAEATSGRDPRKGLDSRSIDELLKFIEGDSKSSTPKKRPGRNTNPKRRGGSSAPV